MVPIYTLIVYKESFAILHLTSEHLGVGRSERKLTVVQGFLALTAYLGDRSCKNSSQRTSALYVNN